MLFIIPETLGNFIMHNIFSKYCTTLGFRPQFSGCDCYKNEVFDKKKGVSYCSVSVFCLIALFKAHLSRHSYYHFCLFPSIFSLLNFFHCKVKNSVVLFSSLL